MYWKQGEQYTGLHQLIYKSVDTVYVGQDGFRSLGLSPGTYDAEEVRKIVRKQGQEFRRRDLPQL